MILEILLPLRGEIYDRNNQILATNKKVYDLYLIPENFTKINFIRVIQHDFI